PRLNARSCRTSLSSTSGKDNLCGDVYLRQHMDEEGFVSVPFMSTTFNKVREITADIPNANLQYIIETIQSSSILEVKGRQS
uniref:HTH La-type RNA-binding domain-containing protein n=1 Tax=Aegilops tauschii subsp. strangulata TaxID=200361 RepID=A0A453MK59_AEGTS